MKEHKKWKHLRVTEEVHKRVKGLAVFKGLGIDETIIYLLDKEKTEKQNTTISNYRKRG
jgi:macrodomain Ter protein organizer (MatP/YcbG family)